MKDHVEYTTKDEIRANVAKIVERRKKGIRSPEEEECDAYFTDPANAEEIAATFARIELVKAMYKARKEAGLTQKEMARKLHKNNLTFPQ